MLKYLNIGGHNMHPDIQEILVSEKAIIARCEELGKKITKDYEGKKPILVALLKGSVPFMAELMKYIDLDLEIDFMDVSSYDGTESVGDVRINKDLSNSVQDDDIILVEDIVDTGRTLKRVIEFLYQKGAKSVKVVSLLDKPDRRVVKIDADYVGFKVPNEFVVGFGLDYNQRYRNLPYVGILKRECY